MKAVAIAHRQSREAVEIAVAQRELHLGDALGHDAGDAVGEERGRGDGGLHAGGGRGRFCGWVGDEDERVQVGPVRVWVELGGGAVGAVG